MSTNHQNDALAPAAARLVELACDSLGELSEEQRVNGARALRVRLEAREGRAGWRSIALVAGAIASLALIGLGVLHYRGTTSSLALRVEGAALEAGGLVRAGSAEPALHFSDGSEIVLSPQGRLHVRSVDEHGAHVTLDTGHAHVYVVHTPLTHWELATGPLVVDVIGTAFEISWSDERQELDLQLQNGVVRVSGPMLGAPLSLRAGQWLTIRQNDVRIRALGAPAATEPTPAPAEPASAVTDGDVAPAPALDSAASAPAPRAGSSRAHWSADLARGKFEAIVSDAIGAGLDVSLAQSSLDELWALADAARYSRHPDIARAALSALRQRFPSSSQARTAAFYLGRLAEAGQDARAALSWFGTYLTEAPNGTYASEALGRRMTLVQRLDGDAAARPLAEAYLHRFSSGTYAEAARALTQ